MNFSFYADVMEIFSLCDEDKPLNLTLDYFFLSFPQMQLNFQAFTHSLMHLSIAKEKPPLIKNLTKRIKGKKKPHFAGRK